MKKPLIGILDYSLVPKRNYQVAAEKLDIDLLAFTPRSINWPEKTIRGLLLLNDEWEEVETSFPDAVYNQYYVPRRSILRRIEKVIGQGKTFNCIAKFNKWTIYQILAKSKVAIYLPETWFFSESDLWRCLEKYKRVILKPCYGTLGEGILKLVFDDQKVRIYRGMRSLNFTQIEEKLMPKLMQLINPNKYIIQRYILLAQIDKRIFDIRTLVQKNREGKWQVTANMSRIALRSYFITNVTYNVITAEEALSRAGFVGDIQKILVEIEEISLLTAKIIERKLGNLGEIGIDFGVDPSGKSWIIEVNGRPTKDHFEMLDDEVVLEKVFLTPIEYAKYLATKER